VCSYLLRYGSRSASMAVQAWLTRPIRQALAFLARLVLRRGKWDDFGHWAERRRLRRLPIARGIIHFRGYRMGRIRLSRVTQVLRLAQLAKQQRSAGLTLRECNFTATAASAGPKITTQPANQTVAAGQTAHVQCCSDGRCPPELPVEQERHRHCRRDFFQLHHACHHFLG